MRPIKPRQIREGGSGSHRICLGKKCKNLTINRRGYCNHCLDEYDGLQSIRLALRYKGEQQK